MRSIKQTGRVPVGKASFKKAASSAFRYLRRIRMDQDNRQTTLLGVVDRHARSAADGAVIVIHGQQAVGMIYHVLIAYPVVDCGLFFTVANHNGFCAELA